MASSNLTNSSASKECGSAWSVSFTVTCAMLVLLGLLIILANLTVILLVCLCKRLKTLTNLCLASLAASDFLAGFLALPLIVACTTTCILELCRAMDLCQRFLAMSTIVHLLVITTERYVMIVHPMVYPRIVTKPRILVVLTGTWTISLFLSLIQLSWSDTSSEDQKRAEKQYLIYDFFCIAFIVVLPLLFMIYAHVHILLVAQRQIRLIKRQVRGSPTSKAQQRKGPLIYLAMIGLFVVGWIPYFMLAIEADSDQASITIPAWALTAFLFLKFGTALFNPLLYTYFKTDFKTELKNFLFRRRSARGATRLAYNTGARLSNATQHEPLTIVVLTETVL